MLYYVQYKQVSQLREVLGKSFISFLCEDIKIDLGPFKKLFSSR